MTSIFCKHISYFFTIRSQVITNVSEELASYFPPLHLAGTFQYLPCRDNERIHKTILSQLASTVRNADRLRKKLSEAEEDNALSEIEDLKKRMKIYEDAIPMWTETLDKFEKDKAEHERIVARGGNKQIVGKEKNCYDLLLQIKYTIVISIVYYIEYFFLLNRGGGR